MTDPNALPLTEGELERLFKSSWPDYPFTARIKATIDALKARIAILDGEIDCHDDEMEQVEHALSCCQQDLAASLIQRLGENHD